jgi:hypothetical protein
LDDELEGFEHVLRSRLIQCDGALGFTQAEAEKLRKLADSPRIFRVRFVSWIRPVGATP